MADLAAFSLSLFAFALLHAAVPARFPLAMPAKKHAAWGVSLRLAAVVCTLASLGLWVAGHAWVIGSVLFVLSWVIAGSVFVVTATVWPRLAWTLALVLPGVALLGGLLAP